MKCSNAIRHRPYIPVSRPDDAKKPYICRAAPDENGFSFDWIDGGSGPARALFYRVRGAEEYRTVPLSSHRVRVDGLEKETEYEFFVRASDGEESNIRLVKTGKNPDGAVVVNYLHPEDTQYIFSGKHLCSPSLVRLPSGRLLAGMDVFGANMGQNLVILYRSDDDGDTWDYLCELSPFYWASTFVHRGKLYVLGLSTEYGNLQITCSEDEGVHFSSPVTLLFGANTLCAVGGPHRAPMQVTAYRGRLYTSVEYGSWTSGGHIPSVLSIDEDDDLMVPENWNLAEFLPYEGRWKEQTGTQGNTIEGNLTVLPDGKLYNVMRWKRREALLLEVDTKNPDARLIYRGVLPMPVTTSMFRVLPFKGGYLLVSNHLPDGEETDMRRPYRNVLSVYYSKDFEKWEFVSDVVDYGGRSDAYYGFQYPCALVEGDTLLVLVRSAYNGAPSFHDSNYSLFFKVDLKGAIARQTDR